MKQGKHFAWKMLLAGWVVITGWNVAALPSRYALPAKAPPLRPAPMPLVVRAEGDLQPKRSFVLKAEFEGPVLSKSFKEGEAVQENQELVEIGRDKIQADYQAKEVAVENAQSDLMKARKDERVQKELYRKEAVAESTVEDAERTAVRAAQALEAAQEAFRLEKELWNKNKILAPFAGMIVKDSLGTTQSTTAGMELAIVADVSEYTVSARVDELEIAQIQIGQLASVTLPSNPGVLLSGKVTAIGAQAEGNGLPDIPVTVKLVTHQKLLLRPGLNAVVRITTGRTPPVLSVPLGAIFSRNGETMVWVLGSWDRLHAKAVKLGRSNPDRAEVVQGLEPGDRVCVKADPHFVAGLRVKIDHG